MAEDISVLGESLLQDTRDRNEQIYKRNKRESYKLAGVQAGMSLVNKALVTGTENFLNAEPMMALRAQQQQGVKDAQFFVDEQAKIEPTGKTPEQYYIDELIPRARARANEELNEGSLSQDGYQARLRELVTPYAERRAEQYRKGLALAGDVGTASDFAKLQELHSNRPTNFMEAVSSGISRWMSGTTQAERDEEAITAIENSGMIQSSQGLAGLRATFAETGNVELALGSVNIAEEFADVGDYVPTVGWRALGNGKVTEIKTPTGGTTLAVAYEAIDLARDGAVITGGDGQPRVRTVVVGGEQSATVNNSRFSGTMRSAIEQVTDDEVGMIQSNVLTILNSLDNVGGEDPREVYNKVVKEFYNQDGTILARELGAHSRILEESLGISPDDSQRIATKVFMSRLEGSVDGRGWGFSLEPEYSYKEVPSPTEFLLAYGELEASGATAVTLTGESWARALNGITQDFASLPESAQDRVVNTIMTNEGGGFDFMFERSGDGETLLEILVGANAPRGVGDPATVGIEPTEAPTEEPSRLDNIVQLGRIGAEKLSSDVLGFLSNAEVPSREELENKSREGIREWQETQRRLQEFRDIPEVSGIPEWTYDMIRVHTDGSNDMEEIKAAVNETVSKVARNYPEIFTMSDEVKGAVVELAHTSSDQGLVMQVIELIKAGDNEGAGELVASSNALRNKGIANHIAKNIKRG